MFSQFFVIFALMITGYVLRKLNIIDDNMNHGMNNLIMYVAFPFFIVYKIGNLDLNSSLLKEFFVCLALSCAFFYGYALYAHFYAKIRKFPKENSNVAEFSMAATNNGFLGFPIVTMFFGEAGLFMMLSTNAALNIFMFTHGLLLLDKSNNTGFSGKMLLNSIIRCAKNPNIIALAIGFVLCISSTPIPDVVNQFLSYLGSICTPLSMIYIGSTLCGTSLFAIIKDRIVVEATISKLLILPAITALILYFAPLPFLTKAVLMLSGALPSAAMVTMMSGQYNQDVVLSGKILFLTTALSMGTLMVTISLINTLF